MIGKIPPRMAERITWTTGSFGLIQLLRLANNVVLARLLSPPLLGLMLIVNSIRTGVELLSDVGINQNIISNRQGNTPAFYDTAWTIKVIRGVGLGAICFALSSLFADFFDEPQLAAILPIIAITFVFGGLQSPSSALLQKERSVARVSMFDTGVAAIFVITHITLALITPTIWALVLGSVISSAVGLIASYLIIPGQRHRLMLDPQSAREILKFGKWIFLSSIIYFLAMNFDRLYFAKQITLTMLGVYSIARAMADMLNNAVIRTSNMVLFPAVASMQVSEPEIRARLLHSRRTLLLLIAFGLAGLVAVSDAAVELLYDARYAEAGTMLPLMLLGVWVSILGTVHDSVMLATARPIYSAIANGSKLVTIIIGVPLAFQSYGLMAAIVAFNIGEVVRYVVLWFFARRKHLAFGRDDLALTVLFAVAILIFRELFFRVGLTDDLDALFPGLAAGLSEVMAHLR